MNLICLLLLVLGCFVVLRSLLLLFTAEMGRKQDLIKHIYKSGTDFQLAIIIPYLDSRKIRPFHDLLQALDKQDYPSHRVGIHVVATEDAAFGLPPLEELPANVKIWTYPAKEAHRGTMLSWLIERLLAASGPSRLFIFLDADDIVRPDFLRSVTTRAYDCFAMQGYVALKRPPKGWFASVAALSTRLINRIENAGRYHLGLSCRLMNSGWVVRQELLEMIPFRQGQDMDNLEYTILLNLSGYRVNWAPNMVIYKDERATLTAIIQDIVRSTLNRIRLAVQYAPRLLVQGVVRLDASLLEQALCILKPPNFMIGFIGLAGTAIALLNPVSAEAFYAWGIFTMAFASTQILTLAVARCSFKDALVFLAATPMIYLAGLVLYPFFFLMTLAESIFQRSTRAKRVRIGKRFDESQPNRRVLLTESRLSRSKSQITKGIFPIQNSEWEDDAQETSAAVSRTSASSSHATKPVSLVTERSAQSFSAIYEEKVMAQTGEAIASHREALPDDNTSARVSSAILPISNGNNKVDCMLHTCVVQDVSGQDEYYLVFEYKNLTFTTQKYRILDQAYYEVQTKLQSRGFTILSCGSCAYFYHPTVGNPHGIAKDQGHCLFGKLGKDIQFDADTVTVVSPACHNYADMVHRSAFLKAWQDSLEEIPII